MGVTEIAGFGMPVALARVADQAYTIAKAVEDYQNEFRWHLPHEHRPAGRPLRFTPLYSTLKAMDAEFGVVNGWERVMFYKPNKSYQSQHSYRFNNWHQIVENEVKSLCNNVGLAEISGFTRYQITGAGVAEWLDTLTCSRLPDSPGDVRLCYFLTDSGNLLSEATLAMLDRDHFWFGSAAAAERHDMDWLTERLPSSSDISIANLTDTITTLVIAGPKLRQLMSAVSPRSEWSGNAFPGMKVRRCRLGEHIAVVMSVSYSGESACEIHISNSELLPAYRLIVETGKGLGLVHFGMHAIESMRIEKGFGHWKADLISEFNPFEAELGHFVDIEKSFPGKVGLQRQLDRGYRKKRMLIEVHSDRAPAQPGESVFSQDRVIGVITSASWGYRYGKNVAMCYLEPEFCENDTKLKVLLLGQWVEANVIPPL